MFLLRALQCFIIGLHELIYCSVPNLAHLVQQLLLLHRLQHKVIGLGRWGVNVLYDFSVGERPLKFGLLMKIVGLLNWVCTFVFVEIVVELLHRLVFLNESMIVLKQFLVFLLIVDFFREFLELNGMPAAEVSGGVDDGGGLVGPHCVQVVHSAWNYVALTVDTAL